MIAIEDLSFRYDKNRPFIERMGFSVRRGEIFGFLGPSGAGKSTLQKILTGVLSDYTGSVVVDGVQVRERSADFYENIGVDFEFVSLYAKFTALENLRFFASLYKSAPRDPMELLHAVGLSAHANQRVSEFSKGMKTRLNFAKALIHKPRMLFLDEPTSGLDPSNARTMKDIIRAERDKGATVILTTHNMHDAAELCDRVAFIVDGHIAALDTPRALALQKGGALIRYSYLQDGREIMADVPLGQSGADPLLCSLIAQNRLRTIHSGEPTLEDIFIEVTGRRLQ